MFCESNYSSNKADKDYLTKLPIELLTMICTFVDIHDIIKLIFVHSIFSFISSSRIIFVTLFKVANKSINKFNPMLIKHDNCNCHIGIMKTEFLHYYWKQHLFKFNIVHDIQGFYDTIKNLNLNIVSKNILYFDTNWYIFYKCTLFCALSRTLSFQPLQNYDIINLYSINLQYRTLNFYEKQIFSPIKIVPNLTTYKILSINNNVSHFKLNNKTIFINKFTTRYFLNIWVQYINWNKFVIAGSSVLACILQGIETNNWLFELNHDVDVFAININYIEFHRQIINFQEQLQNNIVSLTETQYVSTFCLRIENKYIHIQFIWLCKYFNVNSILHNFDMDLVQCSFNPEKNIITTSIAFIQFINTGYATIYSLVNSKSIINIKSRNRMIKYIKRGFHHWLLPSKLNLNILQESLNEKISPTIHVIANDYGFINWTNDSFNVQQHILQLTK